MKIFEWQSRQWASILSNTAELHHALLLAGPPGIGKAAFAEALAARLLCEQPASATAPACGNCEACHWFAGGNHPDYRKIAPAADDAADEEGDAPAPKSATGKRAKAPSTQIKVDQIRELEDFVFMGSHRHGRRVVVIEPAEAMNAAAANSILKILEEPPTGVYFILVSSNSRRLLPTLRSRCRQLRFPLPEKTVAAAWLAGQGVAEPLNELSLVGGAPLAALRRHESGTKNVSMENLIAPLHSQSGDPLAIAGQWDAQLRANAGLGMEVLVDTLQRWVCDLVRVKMSGQPRYMLGFAKPLQELARKAELSRLLRCHGDLVKIRAVARHPLNSQLFLEDMASRYAAAVAGGGR